MVVPGTINMTGSETRGVAHTKTINTTQHIDRQQQQQQQQQHTIQTTHITQRIRSKQGITPEY